MTTIRFGVYDQPYPEVGGKLAKSKKGKKPGKATRTAVRITTTGEVAEMLEEKYGVMQTFYNAHQQEILNAVGEALQTQLENALLGQKTTRAFAEAESEIETMFKQFISNAEIERLGIEGVPTQAALNGVSHRLKHPFKKSNPRRPSFRDTGLYQASFGVEIE